MTYTTTVCVYTIQSWRSAAHKSLHTSTKHHHQILVYMYNNIKCVIYVVMAENQSGVYNPKSIFISLEVACFRIKRFNISNIYSKS